MNDSDMSKLDVRSLSLNTLQEILQQLLKLDNVAQVVSGVLSNSGTETPSPPPQKNKLPHINTQLAIKQNVLDNVYLTSLEVELRGLPFESVRNKPAVLFVSDLDVTYNNKFNLTRGWYLITKCFFLIFFIITKLKISKF